MPRFQPPRAAFRSLRWKLITTSLLAITLPLMLFAYLVASLLWRFYLGQLEEELQTKAFVIADAVSPILSPDTPEDPDALSQMVNGWRRYSNMRVIVADSGGRVQAATLPRFMGQSIGKDQPGMREALRGESNSTVWKSPNFDYEETMYVNVPARLDHRVVGAVRVAYSLTEIRQKVAEIRRWLLVSVSLYALLIILLTFWLSGSIVRPVEKLNQSAHQLALGDLDHRVEPEGTEEITQLAETLNRMAERLGQLEGMRRQYVSNVSHELRTPLASIRGMAETLMLHGESDPALLERYLPRIIGQTERLARLASQLLDLAQIESGNLVDTLAPLPLSSVVEEAVDTCSKGAREKGVELRVEIPEDLPLVNGDHDRLVQVVLNLVDNAIRYSPPGDSVRIAASVEGKKLALEVC
ncbi:MAG: HAMP domain-containing histidine kinase, partial [Armatimonadetes bacterium]|nr:HAMP domain-containing histidine kinase [Armatimonadota bacterium]